MNQPITRRLVGTASNPIGAYNLPRKCPVCGEKFDMLSKDWAYKLHLKGGKVAYYCRYKCWRKKSP